MHLHCPNAIACTRNGWQLQKEIGRGIRNNCIYTFIIYLFHYFFVILIFQVGEMTGDVQMSREQFMLTQLIVCTPEKYDIITRKGIYSAFTILSRLFYYILML
jgi:hypothetical protein